MGDTPIAETSDDSMEFGGRFNAPEHARTNGKSQEILEQHYDCSI